MAQQGQQGPMIRTRARELNYQVKSFLAIHTSSSPNWVLLNYCDDCLILRNVGEGPDWREFKQGDVRTTHSDHKTTPY